MQPIAWSFHHERVLPNSDATLSSVSECSFTCIRNNGNTQNYRGVTRNLPPGLPCGHCMECCYGKCQPVEFQFGNPLKVKTSCKP
uniref:Putative ixostatin n=1 Tax=Ixodes ricinus TaxID=34613 RepID=A0A0K8RG38_IXORI